MRNKRQANYSYKFRLYPTNEQKLFLKKAVGCVRFVYNYMLAKAKECYKESGIKWNVHDYKKQLPTLKKEYPFLAEVYSQSLQEAVFNLDRAFKNFFKKKSDFPVFKKKKNGGSFYLPQGFKIERIDKKWGLLYLPKLKKPIKIRMHRNIDGEVISINIRLTPSGKFYVSLRANKEIKKEKPIDKICAIDFGVKDFAVMVDEDGNIEKINNPKHLQKAKKRLVREQRKLSRKQKGSKNFEKQRLKVAKYHEKVANQREDFLHKLSKRVVSENQAIILEDLHVKGLLKNKHLSKSISDVGWSKFVRYLTYKAQWYDRKTVFANRFYPSSKLCNVCGYKNDFLTLSDREWICPECKSEHDRDINASINLLKYGVTHLKSGRTGTVRTQACGDSSDGGMVEIPVYESSTNEAGSLSIY